MSNVCTHLREIVCVHVYTCVSVAKQGEDEVLNVVAVEAAIERMSGSSRPSTKTPNQFHEQTYSAVFRLGGRVQHEQRMGWRVLASLPLQGTESQHMQQQPGQRMWALEKELRTRAPVQELRTRAAGVEEGQLSLHNPHPHTR